MRKMWENQKSNISLRENPHIVRLYYLMIKTNAVKKYIAKFTFTYLAMAHEFKRKRKCSTSHKSNLLQLTLCICPNLTARACHFHTSRSCIFLGPIGLPLSSSIAVNASGRDSNTAVAEPWGFPLWSYCSETDPGMIRYP